MVSISLKMARRLALARAGLLRAHSPRAGGGGERSLRGRALATIDRFGYLQLDTVSVAGARSHSIVLMSRIPRATPALGESLLRPGAPLFEYWGHEVCWMPLSLYPAFAFRRRRFRHHPWWGDVIGAHPRLAEEILRRVREDGPLQSADLEGQSGKGWWDHKPAKTVAVALWSSGDLAVRERRAFQRTFDLPERVIPDAWRNAPEPTVEEALRILMLRGLEGHGWATAGTLQRTWRLRLMGKDVARALAGLAEEGSIVPCVLAGDPVRGRKKLSGWIRPGDLALAESLARARPAMAHPVLLSPFDPLLWDRERVRLLFGFEISIEIFVPAAKRVYGYYCMPVLAGERLIARVDLKADRKAGVIRVRSCHPESEDVAGVKATAAREVARSAVARYARQAGLAPVWG